MTNAAFPYVLASKLARDPKKATAEDIREFVSTARYLYDRMVAMEYQRRIGEGGMRCNQIKAPAPRRLYGQGTGAHTDVRTIWTGLSCLCASSTIPSSTTETARRRAGRRQCQRGDQAGAHPRISAARPAPMIPACSSAWTPATVAG